MLNTLASTQLYQRPLTPAADPAATAVRSGGEQVDAAENRGSARDQLNVQILEASAKVSLKAGDQSQALLFRGAIERINELLSPTLGPDAIQAKMSRRQLAGSDGRTHPFIIHAAFTTPMPRNAPMTTRKKVAKDFVNLIRGGFEKGFSEAQEILQGLKVFNGDIETGVMKTFELVNKGYDDFLASKLNPESRNCERGKRLDCA
jgi:hypothetical protein